MEQHDPSSSTPQPSHQPAHTPEVKHDMGTPHAKFSLNFNGIDWKKEIMDAIEVVKMNKAKWHEVAARDKATTAGFTFIVAPQLLLFIIALISGSTYFFLSYVISGLCTLVFLYACDLAAKKAFHGKGDFLSLFRVGSYMGVIFLLQPVIGLLSFASYSLWALVGIAPIAVGILMIIVAYHYLMENYKLDSNNAIITIVIAAVSDGIVYAVLTAILVPLFIPKPLNDLNNAINRLIR